MQAMGVPRSLLWPTILFETGAGVLVIIGYQTRIVARLLASFSIMTALVFHTQFADQIQMIMFLKNLSIAGGFALLACVGPDSFSLDAPTDSKMAAR